MFGLVAHFSVTGETPEEAQKFLNELIIAAVPCDGVDFIGDDVDDSINDMEDEE